MKTCKVCQEAKTLDNFPSNGGNRKKPLCKSCYSEKQAEYRAKNRERLREQWRNASDKYYKEHTPTLKRRLQRHGITEDEYVSLMKAQEDSCAICRTKEDLVIDHCHLSMRVRGLLCQACNKSLGGFRDKIENLEAAISYLTSPPGTDIVK